ncbi:uncharacterized protein [Hyperolius riggenbachi]|uniref:uncharacterized protein n=1 Tax=Hyperolius riggenbachi TaxID=752182 RepID=UPI0035A37CA8
MFCSYSIMSALAALAVIFILAVVIRRTARPGRYWVHSLLKDGKEKGLFWALYDDLRKHPEKFFSYTGMSIDSFDELLEEFYNDLKCEDDIFRQAVTPCERLLLTLRFLASWHSYSSLHLEYRLRKSTVKVVVLSTCTLLWSKLQPKFMEIPDQTKWMQVADLFWRRCHFPNCLGAIDRKHVGIVCPTFSGSNFFNDNQLFSMVLLTIVDADYKFLYVDIEPNGGSCDCTSYSNYKFERLLESGRLNLPEPKPWPGTTQPHPFVFIGDGAFELSTHIMQPYDHGSLNSKQRHFNRRLTKARSMVECAFGILAAKWRIFQSSLQITPEDAVCVIKAACVLHNYVREKEGVDLKDSDTPEHLSAQ